jgi:hypothetical protein
MNTSCARDVSLHDQDSHWPAGAPPRTAAEHFDQPPVDSSREGAAETGAAYAGEAAARGRPSTCTPTKVHAICSFIRLTGLSDTAAAAMAGVKRSTLARWKQEDDEVELALEQARFQYQAPRLARIDETRLKNGELDWRAQAWLVKFANPQVHGAPSSRRKLREVELAPEEQQAKELEEEDPFEGWDRYYKSGGVITPQMLAVLQQRRAIALREMHAEEEAAAVAQGNASVEAEAPVPAARSGNAPAETQSAASPATPHTDDARGDFPSAAAPPKSVTIRPEIRGLYREPGGWGRPATGTPAHAAAAGASPAMERRRMEAVSG